MEYEAILGFNATNQIARGGYPEKYWSKFDYGQPLTLDWNEIIFISYNIHTDEEYRPVPPFRSGTQNALDLTEWQSKFDERKRVNNAPVFSVSYE